MTHAKGAKMQAWMGRLAAGAWGVWSICGLAVPSRAATSAQEILRTVDRVVAAGPYKASWESLQTQRVPRWYQDGKFGIFIHWGLYSVPAYGSEWYPRNMYLQGSNEYKHHLETYGPQKQFGYKDFIPRFRAERYDPAHWAELFRKAGARFVVPVAEHHDGFPMYDTALSDWSAARMGPKRDLIGDLARAVRKQGLVFGVSSHRAEHWWFLNGGMKFDSDVRDPRFAAFYGPARPEGTQPDTLYLEDWLARTAELVDKYRPQLLWFDWWIEQPAFKPYLQKLAAFYYNRSAQWGRGVAINYKNSAFPARAAVLDIERGQLAGIRPLFWQTDTSVSRNSWGYVQRQDYKSVDSIVDDLTDIVSKNGALLLNIGPRSDGTIPEPEEQILLGIGEWLKVNGEAIYGTRPWSVFGEGPTQVVGGSFSDTKRGAFTGQDLRFTRKGSTLYAIALAWPGEQLTIRSLAAGSALAPGDVRGVRLLGHRGQLQWRRTPEGLVVRMPDQKPCDHAFALKITGLRLGRGAPPGSADTVTLEPEAAEVQGTRLRAESRGGQPNLGFWDDPKEWASWKARFRRAGTYEVTALASAANGDSELTLEAAGQTLRLRVTRTGGWADFQPVSGGTVEIRRPGTVTVSIRPGDPGAWKAVNLGAVTFRRRS